MQYFITELYLLMCYYKKKLSKNQACIDRISAPKRNAYMFTFNFLDFWRPFVQILMFVSQEHNTKIET